MKLRRDIGSIPLRTADATWDAIINLIADEQSVDVGQLKAAASVMASLITDEHYAENPMTLVGVSHRLVLYCRYGPDAFAAGEGIDRLGWNPTAGEWVMYVPCDEENLDWARNILTSRAPRIVLHDLKEEPVKAAAEASKGTLLVDW